MLNLLAHPCISPLFFGYVAISMIDWSLSCGFLHPLGYMLYASMYAKVGKFDEAERYKKLGLAVQEKWEEYSLLCEYTRGMWLPAKHRFCCAYYLSV